MSDPESILGPFLTQLLGQAPVLLVYVIGIVIAMVNWSRYPKPALLTFLSMALFLITSVLQSFTFVSIVHARTDFAWSASTMAAVLSVNGLMGSLFRAVAFGFLLAAVFVSRSQATPTRRRGESGEPDEPEHPLPRTATDRGITSRPEDVRYRP